MYDDRVHPPRSQRRDRLPGRCVRGDDLVLTAAGQFSKYADQRVTASDQQVCGAPAGQLRDPIHGGHRVDRGPRLNRVARAGQGHEPITYASGADRRTGWKGSVEEAIDIGGRLVEELLDSGVQGLGQTDCSGDAGHVFARLQGAHELAGDSSTLGEFGL